MRLPTFFGKVGPRDSSVPESDGEIRSNDNDCVKKLAQSSFFTDTVNSTRRQVVLVFALLVWAMLTGLTAETLLGLKIVAWSILLVLVAFATATFHYKNGNPDCFLALVSFLLCSFTVLSIISEKHAPILMPSCQLAVFSIYLPYLMQCLQQREKLHIFISAMIVFPSTLISNLDSSTRGRYNLMWPAVFFFFYKLTAICCNKSPATHITYMHLIRALKCTAVLISAAVMFLGAAVGGVALALDLQHVAVFCRIDSILTFGLLCNVYLVMYRWKNPKATIVNGLLRMPMIQILPMIALIMLMNGVLIGIYFCLAFYKALVVIPMLAFVCLYLGLVYFMDTIREVIPIYIHVFWILLSLLATVFSYSIQDSVQDQFSTGNSTLITPPGASEVALTETLSYFDVVWNLLLACFMFTALAVTDMRAKVVAMAARESVAAATPAAVSKAEQARAAELAATAKPPAYFP